jgi:hypothetical protein
MLKNNKERIAGATSRIDIFDYIELLHDGASEHPITVREEKPVLFDHPVVGLDCFAIFLLPLLIKRSARLDAELRQTPPYRAVQQFRKIEACVPRGGPAFARPTQG